jgi:energy-converting hydrogenase Eha subunit B
MMLLRIIAALAALPFTVYATRALFAATRGGGLLSVIVGSAALFVALLFSWFAARGHIPHARTRMAHVLIGAAVAGSVSFAAGFFGPIVFMPDANQGPLLGIFITGPIGFVLGGVLGAIYSWFRFTPVA